MNEPISPESSPTDRSSRRDVAESQRRRRWLIGGAAVVVVAAIVVAVVLVAGGSDDSSTKTATSTPQTSAAPLTAPPSTTNGAKPLAGGICSGQQLEGTQMSSGVIGNNQVGVFAFSNQSKTSCTLKGVAKVALVDADGKPLTSTTTTGGGAVPADLTEQDVTLDPGTQASLVLSWVPIGSGCAQVHSVEFTMPSSKGAVTVDTQFTACNSGALNISPMQSGVVKG
jgi:hypothetical protein